MALHPRLRIFLFATCLLVFAAPALFGAQANCSFTTFDPPSGYTLNSVEGIADDGTVVGQLIDNKTLMPVGFMRSSNGDFTIYTAPQSSTTWIYQQSETGTSSGSYLGSDYKIHGFTLQNNDFAEVSYPGASNTWVFGVNHNGALTGGYGGAGSVKGFLLENGNYTSIEYPKGAVTNPMAVNDNGAVVGVSVTGSMNTGFLWQNGKFTAINYPKSKYGTVLTGINNAGLIVGNRISADRAFAFLYQNGAFESIVYPGADFALVGGINNNGVISGQYYSNAVDTTAFTATCN